MNTHTDCQKETDAAITEEWRAVPGFLGYEVSSIGHVRSYIPSLQYKGEFPRMLNPYYRKGYPFVALKRDGKYHGKAVHVLVALAFIGEKPFGYHTCHNDGDPTNNVVSNLRYDTPVNNTADRKKHGTYLEGELCARALFTNEQAEKIRISHSQGRSLSELVDQYSVSRNTIWSIVSGRTYRSAGGPIGYAGKKKIRKRKPVKKATAKSSVDLDTIKQRIINGEKLDDIASDYNYSPSYIGQLARHQQ